MEEEVKIPLTELDTIAAEDLQMIKAVIPYIHTSEQKSIAIYVKMMELMNTISFFNQAEDEIQACSLHAESESALDMLQNIRAYCGQKQRQMLDSCINMLQAMEMYSSIKDMMDIPGAGDDGDSNGEDGDGTGSGPMGFSGNTAEILKNFLSPEQQEMFETYSGMMDA